MRAAGLLRGAALCFVMGGSIGAQESLKSSFDRTVVPTPGPDPASKIPTWSKATLSNGARLYVVERHALPQVYFSMNIVGGSSQLESDDKAGLGSLTASMMTEGTTLRSGDEISNALQMLGSDRFFSIGGENGLVDFQSLSDRFGATLAIVAEELMHPAFPNDALDRQKQRQIVGLRQTMDVTSGIASLVFPRLLYPQGHPYRRLPTEESINGITREDVVTFYRAFYQPSRASIVVVGDITPAQARAQVEKAFGDWHGMDGAVSSDHADYPVVPAPGPTSIYLVDKPGAAQSTVYAGFAGPPRSTPDYLALRAFNNLFGEQFQGRLNGDIREQKGWSYGYYSRFSYGRGPGQFRTYGEIQTNKTDSALVEIMKELRDIRGARPASQDELNQAKAALIQSLPQRLARISYVADLVNEIYNNGLPDDYWTRFQSGVNALTTADVQRVVDKYIDPEHLTILIVGDRSKIEAPLRATGIAPVVILDIKGNPIG
jgi:zinc protease